VLVHDCGHLGDLRVAGPGRDPQRLVQLVEAALVDRVPLRQVLAQHPGVPAAELDPAQGRDAVADGDDDVEVGQFLGAPG
jgi:hypothetical protein